MMLHVLSQMGGTGDLIPNYEGLSSDATRPLADEGREIFPLIRRDCPVMQHVLSHMGRREAPLLMRMDRKVMVGVLFRWGGGRVEHTPNKKVLSSVISQI